jgi:serine/threonine-protein kinase RsbW
METQLVIELPNDLCAIEQAVEYVMRRCGPCEGWERKYRLNLRVGLTEALSNAMLYGNGQDPCKRVRVDLALGCNVIRIRVTDQGAGFDPCSVPDPTAPANLLKTGGRGLFLMRQLMDEVHFNDQGNSVTLVLRLGPEPDGLGRTADA